MDKEEMRNEIVRDSKELLKELFPRIKKLIWLDDEGEIYFEIDEYEVNNKTRIALLLIGRLYAEYLEITENPIVENKFIAEQLGIKNDVISARISDLKSEGYVVSPRQGNYKFKKQSLTRFLDELDIEGSSD